MAAIAGGRVAVVGMGKLGSRELTAGSDVDLILLYDYDDGADESDGAKPLDADRYFTRLTQRLIAALSAPTAEGVLYEVDMRLRPSGNKGPVATRITCLRKSISARRPGPGSTWRSPAPGRLRRRSLARQRREAVIGEVLAAGATRGRSPPTLPRCAALIDKEKPPRDIWDLKLIPGGLIDIEFIAQYLALIAAARDVPLQRPDTGTLATIRALAPRLMDAGDAATVLRAPRPLHRDFAAHPALHRGGVRARRRPRRAHRSRLPRRRRSRRPHPRRRPRGHGRRGAADIRPADAGRRQGRLSRERGAVSGTAAPAPACPCRSARRTRDGGAGSWRIPRLRSGRQAACASRSTSRAGPVSGIRTETIVPTPSFERMRMRAAVQLAERAGDGEPEAGAALCSWHTGSAPARTAGPILRIADFGMPMPVSLDRQRRRRSTRSRALTRDPAALAW